jgi:hypothetical protein
MTESVCDRAVPTSLFNLLSLPALSCHQISALTNSQTTVQVQQKLYRARPRYEHAPTQ